MPETNSSKLIRTSIWSDGASLSASQLSRKVVETTPEWMLKIVRRVTPSNPKEVAALINYGGGYETLCLVDGAPLPQDIHSVPRGVVDVVVASVKSEQSPDASENQISEYGVVTPEDEIMDHLVEGLTSYPEGVKIYLHSNEADCGLEGTWKEANDRNHIFRIWSRQDNAYSVQTIKRSKEDEENLWSAKGPALHKTNDSGVTNKQPMATEGRRTTPARPWEPHREELVPKATQVEEKAPPPPPRQSEAEKSGRGPSKTTGGKKQPPHQTEENRNIGEASPKRSRLTESMEKQELKQHNKSTNPAPGSPQHIALPGKVAAPAGATTRRVPAKRTIPIAEPIKIGAQSTQVKPAKRTIPTAIQPVVASVASSDNSKVRKNDNVGSKNPLTSAGGKEQSAYAKTLANQKATSQTVTKKPSGTDRKPVLGDGSFLHFSPREVILLCRAFEGKLTPAEIKKKTRNKRDGGAFYSMTDVRQAKKIMKSLDAEVVALRKDVKEHGAKESPPKQEATQSAKKQEDQENVKTKAATESAKKQEAIESAKKQEAIESAKKQEATTEKTAKKQEAIEESTTIQVTDSAKIQEAKDSPKIQEDKDTPKKMARGKEAKEAQVEQADKGQDTEEDDVEAKEGDDEDESDDRDSDKSDTSVKPTSLSSRTKRKKDTPKKMARGKETKRGAEVEPKEKAEDSDNSLSIEKPTISPARKKRKRSSVADTRKRGRARGSRGRTSIK
ncbi:hypothetical protein ACA910_012675 [Epithemia clementina (nom. ined.)]